MTRTEVHRPLPKLKVDISDIVQQEREGNLIDVIPSEPEPPDCEPVSVKNHPDVSKDHFDWVERMYSADNTDWISKQIQHTHTPFALCDEILEKVQIKPEHKVLVISSIEFVVLLLDKYKLKKENIFFLDEGCVRSDLKPMKRAIIQASEMIPMENVMSMEQAKKMKFDFVVGNPPYLKRGWKAFFEIMIHSSQGQVACICPDPTNNLTSFGDSVRNMLLSAGIQEITECSHFFEKVESGKISFFICDKTKKPRDGIFSNAHDPKKLLLDKVIHHGHSTDEAFFSRGSQASISCSKTPHKTDIYSVKCAYSVSNEKLDIVYVEPDAFPRRTKNKEKFTGRFLAINRFFGKNVNDPIYEIHNIEDYVVGYNVIVFKINKNETIDSFRTLYCSKLYKWAMHVMRNGTFDITQSNLGRLPRLDLTKLWTDEELYQVFNLTPEEIAYVESFDLP